MVFEAEKRQGIFDRATRCLRTDSDHEFREVGNTTEVLLNRSNALPVPKFREPGVREAKSMRTSGSAARGVLEEAPMDRHCQFQSENRVRGDTNLARDSRVGLLFSKAPPRTSRLRSSLCLPSIPSQTLGLCSVPLHLFQIQNLSGRWAL